MAEPELKPKPDLEPELEQKPDWESEPKPEVDPPNNVRFDMNDGKRIFMCRLCRNHLATWEKCSHYISGGKQPGYLCYPVVNVKTDHVSSVWFLYKFPVVNVRCNGCDTHLGEKFVSSSHVIFCLHLVALTLNKCTEVFCFIRTGYCFGMEQKSIIHPGRTESLRSMFTQNTISTRKTTAAAFPFPF
ncbi:hypothetical protein J1N35_008694 [Gossypium stocksii]|uniref:Yippee domain-containing protein n=1 Tax=Gossypium stocksii TaxID=47602 RepID=A0A9D3W9K6_9ROSI|nr:hypothetical protein J1N35_008694 [Gossypium stocksii]